MREVLRKGNEYIESIRKSNDAIPGEEISEKIYRMELLVKKEYFSRRRLIRRMSRIWISSWSIICR